MELIVLNIALDLGILNDKIFTIFVFMALFTTIMTNPCLDFLDWFESRNLNFSNRIRDRFQKNVLISFGPARMGAILYQVSKLILPIDRSKITYSGLHITPIREFNITRIGESEDQSFSHLSEAVRQDSFKFQKILRMSENIEETILEVEDSTASDLILMGGGKSLFSDAFFTPTLRGILNHSSSDVAVYIQKHTKELKNILFLSFDESDGRIKDYLLNILEKSECQLSVLNHLRLIEFLDGFESSKGNLIKMGENECPPISWRTYDLLVMSYQTWNRLESEIQDFTHLIPSSLVIKI
jgi:hypothetical protein